MSNPKDLVGSKKAPLGLVPPALEIGASEAMENGASKYGPFNWREKPIEYMTYLVAIKRHINALIDGQDEAEDTGIHHLKHIAAGTGILLDALNIPGDLIDNRPPKGPAADMLRALDKSAPKPSENPVAVTKAKIVESWDEAGKTSMRRVETFVNEMRARTAIEASRLQLACVCPDPKQHLLTCPAWK